MPQTPQAAQARALLASLVQEPFRDNLTHLNDLSARHLFAEARLEALTLASSEPVAHNPFCLIALAELLNEMGYLSDAETTCNQAIAHAKGNTLQDLIRPEGKIRRI